jgi:UDP-N-acetylglucosamine diphosphorylase/glucosamine-1-phosphate N-acetyltransferase
MNITFFDDANRDNLLPLCYMRPTAALRVGILTIAEKWQHYSKGELGYKTQPYLQKKYKALAADDKLCLNGAVCPNDELWAVIKNMKPGQALKKDHVLLAAKVPAAQFNEEECLAKAGEFSAPCNHISRPYHVFALNASELKADFERLTHGRQSATLSATNTLIGPKQQIFLEEGATAEASIFNTNDGPIYLGKNSKVMEGCVVRGGLALLDYATLKMMAKIYGATTVGPHCKVGGEVNNSVFTGYSNKGHDGFLGNSVIGEWCNLGADTNNSNLKNNYEEVKIWSYPKGGFEKTGLQFCGLIMGDHSKCGINTMFNTGTVVGISANIFGAGFPRNFIPSFSWGGPAGFTPYQINKALQTAQLVMQRRQKDLNQIERDILQYIFDKTAQYR